MLTIAESLSQRVSETHTLDSMLVELSREIHARASEHGLSLRRVGLAPSGTSDEVSTRLESSRGRRGFPHLFFLRGEDRDVESIARVFENDERLVVQRAPVWRPVHPQGMRSNKPVAARGNLYQNRARSACGFTDVRPTAHRNDAPPIFVIDVGRPEHPQLKGRVEYHGAADPPMSNLVHGTRVCGIISAAPGAEGFEGCCNAPISFHNVVQRSPDGQLGFDIASFYVALRKFYESPSRVLNLSMSADSDDHIAAMIFRAVREAEKMIVVAMPSAGDTSTFPASLSSVIGVGGINDVGDAAYDAPANCRALISAPSYKLDVLHVNGGYYIDSGTSFAAPAVSAALWLALLEHPTATHRELRAALSSSVVAGALSGALPDRERGFGRLHVPTMLGAL